jgi:hypothetical protein
MARCRLSLLPTSSATLRAASAFAGTEKFEKRSVFQHIGNITGANNTALPHYIREMSTSDFYPTGHHTQWMEVECDIFSPP